MAIKTYSPIGPITNLVQQVSGLQRLRKRNKALFKTLTDREIEVLTLVARGMKSAAIAEKLKISTLTVQNHRSNIREKLNVDNQTEYVKYALAYDLISF